MISIKQDVALLNFGKANAMLTIRYMYLHLVGIYVTATVIPSGEILKKLYRLALFENPTDARISMQERSPIPVESKSRWLKIKTNNPTTN